MRPILALIVVVLCLAPCAAQDSDTKQPKVSDESLTAEQIAVYRAVLQDYLKDSKDSLNLANKTESLPVSVAEGGCVPAFTLEATPKASPVVHRIGAEVVRNFKVVLVDPDLQQERIKRGDPQNLITREIDQGKEFSDKQINDALKEAFRNGLFALSETAFGKDDRTVVVSYSFVCGRLCGHGATLLLKKSGDKWKVNKRCGEWIS